MSKTNGLIKHTLQQGLLATTSTTMALGALGAAQSRDPIGPINAVSHILYGDEEAMTTSDIDARHTLAGAGLNSASVTLWAGVFELLFGRWARRGTRQAFAAGAMVSGLAYAVDYHVVPKRLTPGFEQKLSPKRLVAVYGILAASLAVGALLSRDQPSR